MSTHPDFSSTEVSFPSGLLDIFNGATSVALEGNRFRFQTSPCRPLLEYQLGCPARTHLAIQEALDGVNVVWTEKISDQDYLSAIGEAPDHEH